MSTHRVSLDLNLWDEFFAASLASLNPAKHDVSSVVSDAKYQADEALALWKSRWSSLMHLDPDFYSDKHQCRFRWQAYFRAGLAASNPFKYDVEHNARKAAELADLALKIWIERRDAEREGGQTA